MADLAPDVRLALAYAPPRLRRKLAPLFALDAVLGAQLALAKEPVLAQLRLAWWREELVKLKQRPALGDPVLLSLLPVVKAYPEMADMLPGMADGWACLAGEPGEEAAREFARLRGGGLFGAAGLALGASPRGLDEAGSWWAMAGLLTGAHGERLSRLAAGMLPPLPGLDRAKDLRPLALLLRYAAHDVIALRRRRPFGPGPRRIAQTLGQLLGTAPPML